ncbi:MAG: DUF3137 domain-containing protein [Lachnospiraceae bacterium]|nr:DUF3137 domain-containing protein [Lachnospiraceae bacterium]
MELNEIINKLEVMRKRKNKYAILAISCIFIIMPVTTVASFIADTLGAIIGFVGVMVLMIVFLKLAGRDTNEYKRMYKENFVVGILNEVFDNVTYKYNSGLPEQDVRQFGLVKMGNRYSSEDYLKGSYKGIGFEQAEVTIKYDKNSDDTQLRFKGRMIAFDFPFKEVKSVQVFSKSFHYRDTPKVSGVMQSVEMENTDFNKRFDVLAADTVDAFYVLTPQFMERVDFLKEKYMHVGMNFQGNKLYVGIWTSGDAFDGDTTRSVNLLDEKATIMKDVRVITDIIDVLGMMRDKEENM